MKICIIGGGTAGWWCAAYMQKFLDAEITLIESDEIPTSGVGESSLPQIGVFFEELGIPEEKWMNGCNAVHKYGNMKYEWDGVGKDPFLMTFWYNAFFASGRIVSIIPATLSILQLRRPLHMKDDISLKIVAISCFKQK